MAEATMLQRLDVMLRPDPSRTVVRPFAPEDPQAFAVEGHPRVQRIATRVLGLDAPTLAAELAQITLSLDERHRDVDAMLLRRYDAIAPTLALDGPVDEDRRRLIGAYLSEEYSFEAAALFNPSVVLHPDQAGAPEGGIRIVVSLRGIGEGHVSSVTFREGHWTPGGPLVIDAASPAAVPPTTRPKDPADDCTLVELDCCDSRDVSETVLFPFLPSQRQGIEDLRLCRFVEDDGTVTFHGTYTAFSGSEARSELLSGSDFRSFTMRLMSGAAAGTKGMALFPRRIDGRFAMIGRMDNENLWLLRSDDLLHWEGGEKLMGPEYPWEFIQMGNCGSPIEVDEGWLVLTHGVGMVRNYCMGACLLDRHDPSKVLGRTSRPILEPSPQERNGYVPNVVYSCGALVVGRQLLLPYGVADSFASFATASVDDLVAAMS